MSFFFGCAHASKTNLPELKTVEYVDLSRYLGKWYEIASLPQKFQKDCLATTAQYSARDDGKIEVLNECRLKTLDGKLKSAKGVAKVVDSVSNAKLKVSFFWPFYGDYWVIDLGSNYEYAVVGHPDRNYFWILSRAPKMADDVFDNIIKRALAQGFDLTDLKKTIHHE